MTSSPRYRPRKASWHALQGGCLLVASQLLTGVPASAQGTAPAGTTKPPPARTTTGSGWAALTPAQQDALQPLGPSWGGMNANQQRKWLALSQNFQSLSPAERSVLHARMSEWASLSPVQRSQARLNFAQTKQLTTDEKKAEWQAYQALPLEQKQRLAAGGQALPSGAAPALQPVAPQKLATVPVTRSEPTAVAPGRVQPARAASGPNPRP